MIDERWMIDEEEDSHRIAGRRISPTGSVAPTLSTANKMDGDG
jgi:hypothetical protein